MRKAMIVLLSIAGYWVVCMCLAGCAVLKVEDATMQSQPVWGEYEEGQMFIFEDVFDFQWDSVKIVNGIIRNPYYDLTELYEYAPQYEHGLLYDYHNALVFYNKGQVVDIEVYTTNNYHPYCFFEEDDLVVGTWYKELTPAEAVFECVRVSEGTHYYYFDLCDEERLGEL